MTTIAMTPTMTPTSAPTGNPSRRGARGDGGGVGGEGGELGGGGKAGEGGGARGVISGDDGGTAVASGAQCWACTPIAAHARPHHRSKNGSLPRRTPGSPTDPKESPQRCPSPRLNDARQMSFHCRSSTRTKPGPRPDPVQLSRRPESRRSRQPSPSHSSISCRPSPHCSRCTGLAWHWQAVLGVHSHCCARSATPQVKERFAPREGRRDLPRIQRKVRSVVRRPG